MTGGTHRLESRMREIRPSGSEGGGAGNRSPYPYQAKRPHIGWRISIWNSNDGVKMCFCLGHEAFGRMNFGTNPAQGE